MGKKSKKKERRAQASSLHNAFEAARRSNYRGLFWFPELDAEKKLPRLTREQIWRNNAWLYDNLAPVRMMIDGLSLDEVDTGTWPKATTSNPDFNKAITDDFHEINKDPRFFSASGMENYYSAQWMIRRVIRLYGEGYAQLLRGGDYLKVPTAHFISPWQCVNSGEESPESGWRDGHQRDQFNRAINYRFRTGKDGEKDSFTTIPAEDILHFHDQLWPGQSRSTGILTPCTRSLFSFDDIEKAEIASLLARSRIAYTITRKAGGDEGPVLLPGAGAVEKIQTPDGGEVVVQHLTANARGGGGTEIDVANVPAGFDMKVLESNRAVMTIDVLKWILNSAASASLYPPEYVFNLAGLTQGTLVRLTQRRVQRVKNSVRQFQLIPQFCEVWYRFWAWQRIRMGRYRNVPGGIPEDWYRQKTICPADDTVDLGREGRLYDERMDTGKISPETYHGAGGEDASDVEDEVIAAEIRRAAKIKKAQEENPELVPFMRANPFASKAQAAATPVDTNPDEPETPPTKTNG